MKDWTIIPLLTGMASAGAFLRYNSMGNTKAAVFCFVCLFASAVLYFVLQDEEGAGQTSEASNQQPQERYSYFEEAQGPRVTFGGAAATVLTHVGAGAAVALGAGGQAAHDGYEGFKQKPSFWSGVILAIFAALSCVGGMLGWWVLWKGSHMGGVLALLSAGFFLSYKEKWDEFLEFSYHHLATIWLIVSLSGILLTALHPKWPTAVLMVGFVISAIAAAITMIEGGWKVAGEKLLLWCFKSGLLSAVIWLTLFSAILLAFFSPVLLFKQAVTAVMGSAMIFYGVILVVLGTVLFKFLKRWI